MARSETEATRPTEAPPVFPFIVGSGRSGTTLVRAILDSHPDLAIPYETHFIVSMGERRRCYETPGRFDVDRFVADVYGHTDLAHAWKLERDDVRAELERAQPRSYPGAVRALFALYARRNGKRLYGNKTPIHALSIPAIAALFPESRFVHVIRDGRDVALAFLTNDFGPQTIEAAALHWKRYVRTGRRTGAGLGSARYLELRYEDLTGDAEAEVRRMCSFLGVSYDDRMLRYFERADEVIPSTAAVRVHQSLRLPPTKGLRDWRTQMADRDVRRFESIAGDVLSAAGYERRFNRIPAPARVGATSAVVATVARRNVNKIVRRIGGGAS